MEELRHDVIASSYLRGSFQLSSLGSTAVYFDKYRFLTQPSILRRVALAIATRIAPGTDRLACAELGGVAIAAAVSLELGLPYVVLRRDPRYPSDYEGEVTDGDQIVLLEDVVATGEHAAASVQRLRANGAVVRDCIVIVDRSEGGGERLEVLDVRLDALFVVPDLLPDR